MVRCGLGGERLRIGYLWDIQCICIFPSPTDRARALAQEKKSKKKIKKDSQLIIRINAGERDRFVALCDELDTSAAREIRGFIKSFMQQHGSDDEDGSPK